MSSSFRLTLEGVAWLAGWQLARILPERVVVRGFEAMSARSYRRNEKRREQVRRNLEPVVPPERLDDTVRDAFRWYGRYWAETFRMPDLATERFERRFRVDGEQHLDNAWKEGKGAVYATLHQGNWDAGGRWAAARYGLTVVVEVLRPRMLFDRFVAHRRALGMKIIPLERGIDPTARCLEELAQGRFVALVADRDLSASGIEVEMFGRSVKLPAGPAVLALRTGAPLIPATIYQREDGSWDAEVLPPIEQPPAAAPDAVPVLTQRLAKAYEYFIRREPSQWHMFSRYWIDE